MKLTRRELYLLWIALALCTVWISGCAMQPTRVADKTKECEALGLKAEPVYSAIGNIIFTRIQCVPKGAVTTPPKRQQTDSSQGIDENIRNEIREACIRQLIMKGGFADFTVCQ